ncbi:glycosyltransferase family 4 protein [Gryllotalpicola ginsengisoli]|uniref:glycosyltransferase family 4 protein n=1 Tax=Gryllotalpicola ginsengisoli TaxID=444608 RepID=UPI0004104E9D|nr:glycosyltransferase family 4 protein [Gryllotalpicola ginsengisoli]
MTLTPQPSPARMLPVVAHVPMALSVRSSTLMTVADEVSGAYGRAGGRSLAVLSHNRDVGLANADNVYVDYTRDCPRQWFTKRELAADVAAGALGLLRPHYGHAYDVAVEALTDAAPGAVLLYEGHYASASLPRWAPVRRRGAELILYVHNPLSRSYGRRELGRLLAGADRVVFCADHLRRDVVRRLGHDDPRLEVVWNGVDEAFIAGRLREQPDPFVILFVGKLTPEKGAHLVLDAALQLPASVRKRAVVRFVGSSGYGGGPPSRCELELRARAADAGVRVEFAGWVAHDELPAEYARAGALCLPSQWNEGLPLVALEGMASGTPVVCSDAPGLVEAVGEVGLVAPGGDPATMGRLIAELAEDAERWRELSAASVHRARGYTWERTARALAGLPVSATEPERVDDNG